MLKKDKNNVSYKTKKSLITATLCPRRESAVFLLTKPEATALLLGIRTITYGVKYDIKNTKANKKVFHKYI